MKLQLRESTVHAGKSSIVRRRMQPLMTRLTDELNHNHFRVAVFGSARIRKNTQVYKLVYNLARLIASAGMDLVTGGGPGLMDAASEGYHRGKKDDTQHSIGLNIKLPHEQKETSHLDIKKDFERFSGRLDHFMLLSHAVVVAPGGVGTLLGLFYTWQLMQVKQICNMPIILMGDMWFGLMEWLEREPLKGKLIDPEDLSLLFATRNCEEAFTVLSKCHEAYRNGEAENFCMNYRKYRVR